MINLLRLLGTPEALRQLRLTLSATPWQALIPAGSEDNDIGPESYRGGQHTSSHGQWPGGAARDGHFLHLERPEAFNQRMLDFFG